MKKILNKLTWKDAILPLPALLTIILWLTLSGCSKQHIAPKPLYSSVLGNWKYESDVIKVYFTLTDSISSRWATHGIVAYKPVIEHQIVSEISSANSGDNYNIVCSNLEVILVNPVANNNYTTLTTPQLVLYYGIPNPIVVANVTFIRR